MSGGTVLAASLVLPGAMRALVKREVPTGSRVICKPPPTDTDEDWLLLVEDGRAFHVAADAAGWSTPIDPALIEQYPEGFVSYREGDINLIATSDQDFYDRFEAATQVARRLNVKDKADRVALFHAVLFAQKCDEVQP